MSTSADINPNFEPLLVETLDSNAVVIGGPHSSAHARALFGAANHPSILPATLPVHFRMRDDGTCLIINGKETREEYFLLTNLPMADHRLINISSLKQAGGKAADMIFDNERIIDDLFVRTRPMQSGGWQALFRVHTRGDEPLSVEPEFGLFEVQGIDFDKPYYALNNPQFLRQYADEKQGTSVFKIERSRQFGYNPSLDRDKKPPRCLAWVT